MHLRPGTRVLITGASRGVGRVTAEAFAGRAVYYPKPLRALRAAHGLSPRLADRLVRRMRGRSAAPRG